MARIFVESETVVDAAGVVPNDAMHPLAKFVPVSVTTVPPAGGPLVGFTLVNVGGGVTGATTLTTPFILVPVGELWSEQ